MKTKALNMSSTWQEIKASVDRMDKRGRTKQYGANKTWRIDGDGSYVLRLYDTDIVRVYLDVNDLPERIVVVTNGWYTNQTRNNINNLLLKLREARRAGTGDDDTCRSPFVTLRGGSRSIYDATYNEYVQVPRSYIALCDRPVGTRQKEPTTLHPFVDGCTINLATNQVTYERLVDVLHRTCLDNINKACSALAFGDEDEVGNYCAYQPRKRDVEWYETSPYTFYEPNDIERDRRAAEQRADLAKFNEDIADLLRGTGVFCDDERAWFNEA